VVLCSGTVTSQAESPSGSSHNCKKTVSSRVRALSGIGLRIESSGSNRQSPQCVLFGDVAQRVLAVLGPPCRTFWRPGGEAWLGGASAALFFNYDRLGIDVGFDCEMYRVVKFVLHANVPGHYDFGIGSKCSFSCEVTENGGEDESLMERSLIDSQPKKVASESPSDTGAGAVGKKTEDALSHTISGGLSSAWDSGSDGEVHCEQDSAAASRLFSPSRAWESALAVEMQITPETKWDQVLRRFKLPKPVTMTRSPLPNTINPFGATHFYNISSFVFEVVPATSQIATVHMFPS